jgi:transcriptional regulator with XRE-family HTH domain
MTRLRQLRLSYGLSIEDVAKATGLHKTHLYRLETRDITHPKPKTLQKLSDFYWLAPSAIERMIREER